MFLSPFLYCSNIYLVSVRLCGIRSVRFYSVCFCSTNLALQFFVMFGITKNAYSKFFFFAAILH